MHIMHLIKRTNRNSSTLQDEDPIRLGLRIERVFACMIDLLLLHYILSEAFAALEASQLMDETPNSCLDRYKMQFYTGSFL